MNNRIYFDACCLNRPFDDQRQDRIRLESEAILLILGHIGRNELTWIGGDVLAFEIAQTPNLERKRRVQNLMRDDQVTVILTDEVIARAKRIEQLGFGGFDAHHLASAEAGKSDVFLTTDDKLMKRAERFAEHLEVAVANPATWLWEDHDDH